jgi:hypothetical protein
MWLHAVRLALLAPLNLAACAERLAEAATRLAAMTAENTNLDIGMTLQRPDFLELDEHSQAFRSAVVEGDVAAG